MTQTPAPQSTEHFIHVLRQTLAQLNEMSLSERTSQTAELGEEAAQQRYPVAELEVLPGEDTAQGEGQGARLRLRSPSAEETFTLQGSLLQGQAGVFDLQYPLEASASVLSVLGRRAVTEAEEDEDGVLSSVLFLNGTLERSVLPVRFKYHAWLTLLHVQCGQQRLWLIQRDEDHHDLDTLSTWYCGPHIVAAYKSFVTQEDLCDPQTQDTGPGRNVFPLTPTVLSALLAGLQPPAVPQDLARSPASVWHREGGTEQAYLELARAQRRLRRSPQN